MLLHVPVSIKPSSGNTDCKLPNDGLIKPKYVGAFVIYFNVNFNVLKQIYCALVGVIKDWSCKLLYTY